MSQPARSADVITFPKSVRKGRKRVSQQIGTGAGDLSLMLIEKHGGDVPSNVIRLVTASDERPEPGRTALGLAAAIFTFLDREHKELLRNSLRCMKYGSNRSNRELAVEVERIIGRAAHMSGEA